LYKKAHNSKGIINLPLEDREELKRCKLLQKLIKKINKIDHTGLQGIEDYLKTQG
jgi:hypothetical protein